MTSSEQAAPARPVGHVRLGYARASATPRLDRAAVTERATGLARRGRGHPRLLGEDLHPCHHAPRPGQGREARGGLVSGPGHRGRPRPHRRPSSKPPGPPPSAAPLRRTSRADPDLDEAKSRNPNRPTVSPARRGPEPMSPTGGAADPGPARRNAPHAGPPWRDVGDVSRAHVRRSITPWWPLPILNRRGCPARVVVRTGRWVMAWVRRCRWWPCGGGRRGPWRGCRTVRRSTRCGGGCGSGRGRPIGSWVRGMP